MSASPAGAAGAGAPAGDDGADEEVLAEVEADGRRWAFVAPRAAPDLVLCRRVSAGEGEVGGALVEDEGEVRAALGALLGARFAATPLELELEDGVQRVWVRLSLDVDGRQHVLVGASPALDAPLLVLARDDAGALRVVDDPQALARFAARRAEVEARSRALLDGLLADAGAAGAAAGDAPAGEEPPPPTVAEAEATLAELRVLLRGLPAWAEGTPQRRELAALVARLEDGVELLREAAAAGQAGRGPG